MGYENEVGKWNNRRWNENALNKKNVLVSD